MSIFFPKSTKKTINLFGDLHNEYYINKKINNQIKEYIVPIHFASAEKMIQLIRYKRDNNNIPEASYNIDLPVIGFSITSIDIDEDRIRRKTNKIFSSDNKQFIFQPVPYNYTFDLAVYARTMNDVFNIFEQIITKYSKARYYSLISFKFKDGSSIKDDVVVELNATSLNLVTEDIETESDRVLKINLTFLVKSWIYNSFKIDDITVSSVDNYINNKTYYKNDIVSYNGKIYKSLRNNNNELPTNTNYWIENNGYDKNNDPLMFNQYAYTNSKIPLIEYIDIDFENKQEAKFENLNIYESTGGTLVKDINGFV